MLGENTQLFRENVSWYNDANDMIIETTSSSHDLSRITLKWLLSLRNWEQAELMIDFSWTRVSDCYTCGWFHVRQLCEGVLSIRQVPLRADCWENAWWKWKVVSCHCKLIQWRQWYDLLGYIEVTQSLPSYVWMGALFEKSRMGRFSGAICVCNLNATLGNMLRCVNNVAYWWIWLQDRQEMRACWFT